MRGLLVDHGGALDDDRQPRRGVFLVADGDRELVAAHLGHVQVGQQQRVGRPLLAPHLQRHPAVLGQLAGVAEQLELMPDHLAVDLVVLRDQDQRLWLGCRFGLGGGWRRFGLRAVGLPGLPGLPER